MKKLLILANLDSGLYKFRKELIQRFLAEGYQIYLSVPEGSYAGPLQELGCNMIPTGIDRRSINPWKDLKLLKKYSDIIDKVRPHLIITYTIKPNIYGSLVANRKHYPYYVNVTGLGSSFEKKNLLRIIVILLYKAALKNVRCIFFENQSNHDVFQKFGIIKKKKTKVLPGAGVNLDEYRLTPYPPKDSETHILFVGRIMKEKGMDELLSAIPALKEKYRNLIFDIVGPFEEDYDKMIHKMQDGQMICYHGFQSDVRPFIQACHALVLPSYHEGMSNVLLEAASMGRPILTTNIPGCKETLIEGKSGLGFCPQDTIALKETLEKFLSLSWEEKRAMGLNGRKKMEQDFNKKDIVEMTYQTIIQTDDLS